MSSYLTKQTSVSASNIMVYGLLVGQLVAGGEAVANPAPEQQGINQSPYDTHASLPSFDQFYKTIATIPAASIDQQLVEAVSDFYAALLQKQEALGEEFEQVLYDNLWDLYEQ